MSELLGFLLALILVSALAWLVWWLLIESEGVYLGRRVVIWLYDLVASRYDDIKRFRSEYDHQCLAQPLMQRVAPDKAPLVLDVATGTARLPLALLNHSLFQGRVIGLDLSRRMLARAAVKLEGDARAPLIWASAERLPFPDDTFDVVTCLEALEFMRQPQRVLAELARVLRPGGTLLITNRISTRWMPGHTWTEDEARAHLQAVGCTEIDFETWQVDYQLVWAVKGGLNAPTRSRPLIEVLRCPICGKVAFAPAASALVCESCGASAPIGTDGVIELEAIRRRRA